MALSLATATVSPSGSKEAWLTQEATMAPLTCTRHAWCQRWLLCHMASSVLRQPEAQRQAHGQRGLSNQPSVLSQALVRPSAAADGHHGVGSLPGRQPWRCLWPPVHSQAAAHLGAVGGSDHVQAVGQLG